MNMPNAFLCIVNQVYDQIMKQCFYFYHMFCVSYIIIYLLLFIISNIFFLNVVYTILSTNDINSNLIYEELQAVISNDVDDITTNNTNIPETINNIMAGRQIAMEYEITNSSEQQNETTTRVMYVKTAFTLFDFLFKWSREQKASKNNICEPVMSNIIVLI